MAPLRKATQRKRRHAGRARPWSQFPWTLLGMAFITGLFLASYQSGASVVTIDPGTSSYQER